MPGEEAALLRRVMMLASRSGARLFRQNVGVAWQGDALKLPNGDLLLENPRRVHMGLFKGSSDLIGWKTVTVTPEMVGSRLAIFAAIEGKSKTGRVRPEQETFIAAVKEAGGLAGVARTEEQALEVLEADRGQSISDSMSSRSARDTPL